MSVIWIDPSKFAASFTPPATSYANTGGTGNRTATITATSNITWDGGSTSNLINGSTSGTNTSVAVDEPGTGGTAISDGDYIRFQFGSAKYINEVKAYHNGTVNHGNWKWQVSNDGSSWVDASSSTAWNGTSQTFTIAPDNRYTYYQFINVGGGVNWPNTWIQEFEFKIEA